MVDLTQPWCPPGAREPRDLYIRMLIRSAPTSSPKSICFSLHPSGVYKSDPYLLQGTTLMIDVM
jgi:hypothetical protein